METLKSLIEKEEHEKILELPSPEYNKYKVIAAIHLDRYEEALRYAQKSSFEQAYVYYKLKQFKKALKILKKLTGRAVNILKSQCLYLMGYYSAAYKLLFSYGTSDSYGVNLSAMEALGRLNNGDRIRPTVATSKDNGMQSGSHSFKFTNAEYRLESEYNMTFKYIEDEKMWVEELLELQKKYNVDGSCIDKQLKNLMCVDVPHPTIREAEILAFNNGTIPTVQKPVIFQQNFINDGKGTDFQIFRDYFMNQDAYQRGKAEFQPSTDRLRILKSLIISKRKNSSENLAKIEKTLSLVKSNSIEKRIIQFLAKELPEEEFQKQALKLIFEAVESE